MATSVVVIEELTGQKRQLTLLGAGLPFRGAPFGGTTALATQVNPGNPEATQHVIAPSRTPTDFEGMWRTTMLISAPCQWVDSDGGSQQPIATAASLMRIVDDLQQSCQLLRVTWTNQQGPRSLSIVRLGRLQEFVPKPDTLDDIAWTMHFEWVSDGGAQRTLNTQQDDILAASRDAIIVQNAAAAQIEEDNIRASRQTQNAATQFNLGDLESLAGAPLAMLDSFANVVTNASSELKNLGDLIVKVRDIPASLAGRALTVATNAVATTNNFLDEVTSQGPETVALRNDAAYLVLACSYYADSQQSAQSTLAVNQRLAQQARSRRSALAPGDSSGASGRLQQSDILQVYLPKDGDTFAKIANRFYQNGDLGSEIAAVNGISRYAIVPPRRAALVIPTRAVIDQRVAAGL